MLYSVVFVAALSPGLALTTLLPVAAMAAEARSSLPLVLTLLPFSFFAPSSPSGGRAPCPSFCLRTCATSTPLYNYKFSSSSHLAGRHRGVVVSRRSRHAIDRGSNPTFGSRLSALGSRLSALGSRLSAESLARQASMYARPRPRPRFVFVKLFLHGG